MESGSDEDVRKGRVSDAVIRRLPRYFRHLTDLELAGVERISSSALGQSMNLTASQIRQDLSCFGEFGQQGYGYKVENLRREIADILGCSLSTVKRAIRKARKHLQNKFHIT